MPFETCSIIQLKEIFPQLQATFFIRSDFKHREAINRMFIQMRSAGIIQRIYQNNRKNLLKKNYETKREYKVYSEGVQFDHVRYIVYGYSCAVLLALGILVCENIYYYIKNCKNRKQNQVPADLHEALKNFRILDEDLLDEIINSL